MDQNKQEQQTQIQPHVSTEQANLFAILKQGNQAAQVINEKSKRCRDFKELQDYDSIPLCYKENTPKEELVLEHVIQFKLQFNKHFDEKRELFMFPKNECDVYKFISTTIRPQKLGFLELYNYDTCAQYLSNFIQYEQMDPPDQFPSVIPSPANVMKWQKGDSFDLSILLTSLLIGVGYDAYCVFGLAPRDITTKNESLLDSLIFDKGIEQQQFDEEEENLEIYNKPKEKDVKNEFTITKKPEVISKFDKKMQEKEKQEKEEKEKKALTIDDDEPDVMGADPYIGKRIHCWVLLKAGKRQVEKSVFIEPSTGRIYPLDLSPYLMVDAVFSNKNFWINMKPDVALKEINFDDMDTSLNWEFAMLDTLLFQDKQNNEDEGHNEIQDENQQNNVVRSNQIQKDMEQQQLKDISQILDMPPPWSPKIWVDKDRFMKGTPLGESTGFYLKCKVEKFAAYGQPDGLILRITIYEDYKRLKVKEIRYFYEHRSDKLILKRRYPFQFKTIEYYGPGRPPHWKEIIYIDRKLKITKYYPNRNQDGLIKRIEIIGTKTIEFYQNRDDKIVYRSVRFDPNKQSTSARDYVYVDQHITSNVFVLKMTQKFSKNQVMNANEQIYKMVVDLVKQQVIIFYHMNQGEINPIKKIYPRESMLGFAKLQETGNEKKADDPLVQQENQKILNMEKDCFNFFKQQEQLIQEENKLIKEESLTLEKTIHDKARERFKEQSKKNEEDLSKEAAAKDYLYPFLEKRMWLNKTAFTYNEAVELKNDVMGKLKERLLSRAEIIQKKLEEERHRLEQAEQQIQKTSTIDKDYENEINNLNFKIDILEQRALRFEAMALQKYEEKDRQLNEDTRLTQLKQKN